MTIENFLKGEFDILGQEFIKKYDDLGMRASGEWADTLESKVEKKGESLFVAQIWAQDYTEQLVDGRKPGSFPNISAIEKWIVDKGLTPLENDITISSLAFLIARKIAREGTEYFKQGGTDLIEAVYTPQRVQSILDKVQEINVDFAVYSAVEQLKEFAA
jgi:hypothetical protein